MYKFIKENEQTINEMVGIECSNTQDYRQEAIEHANVKQQFFNKAKQSARTKINPAVTAYYLQKVVMNLNIFLLSLILYINVILFNVFLRLMNPKQMNNMLKRKP